MFSSIIALSLFSIHGVDIQLPSFSYNGSGYIFTHQFDGWHVVGQSNAANRGTAQSLLEKQKDTVYLDNLYEISLADSRDVSTDVLAKLLATLPMPNVAYIDLSGVTGADVLCQGLSQNRTFRNLRVIFLDNSDVTMQGLNSILGIGIPDNLSSDEQQYCLVRDMKARSMMYNIPIASLQISIKGAPNLNQKDVHLLEGRLSSGKWPVIYLNNDAPEMAPLLFQLRA